MYPRTILAGCAAAALVAWACDSPSAALTGPDGTPRGDHTLNPCDHDVTPPVISSLGASPNVLWPPNHKMVPVTIGITATDNCSAVTSGIASVTSDEPVDGLGDGHTSPDWEVTGPLTLLLRAERAGTGDGRVYTIVVSGSDAAGNVVSQATTVTVPHDRGR